MIVQIRNRTIDDASLAILGTRPDCHYCPNLAVEEVEIVSESGLLKRQVITPFNLCEPHFRVIKMFVDLLQIYG